MEKAINFIKNIIETGILQGVAAFLIFAGVIGFSGIIKLRDSFGGEDKSNSNSTPISNQQRQTQTQQQPTPARMSDDGDSGSSTPPPTATPMPTATTDYSNANKVANSNPTSGMWRVITPTELRDSPSEYGNSIKTLVVGDSLLMLERKSNSSKWYVVIAEDGKRGWVDGMDIEEKK